MIRRILVIGSVGLVLVGAGRLALEELTERRWEQRRAELLELAILPTSARRPWEVRFESLSERVQSSPRFDEIVDSSYRPYPALGNGEARVLNEFERLWLETMWGELAGLDGVLSALRPLPLDELSWHGEATPRLLLARELTNALCGRAWLALEGEDLAGAVRAWTDALRLARALDDGTIIGTIVRGSSENIVLRSVRSGLELGASASTLRAELLPFYQDWGNVAVRAEHAIRRDLSLLTELPAELDDPEQALGFCRGVEEAIERARGPAAQIIREERNDEHATASAWRQITLHLHDLHARRNVAFTALAVAAHREQHGVFPAALADLALEPEFTLDPRSGTELPYSSGNFEAQVGPPSWAEAYTDPESPSVYSWTLR